MSNLFKSKANPTGATWFPVPQMLVTTNFLKRPGSELRLYLFLVSEAQRNSTAWLEFSNQQIWERTGLSPASQRRARTKLWEHKFIVPIQRLGECWLYVVWDPVKDEPAKTVPEKFRETYERWKRANTKPLHSLSCSQLGRE